MRDFYNNSYGFDLDILLLSETKLKPSVLNSEILSNNFIIFRKDRRSDNVGGGVLIAARSYYHCEEIQIDLDMDIEIICMKISLRKFSLFLTCSYVPPRSKWEIYDAHLNFINKVISLMNDNDKIIVMGDFNLPLVSWVADDNPRSLRPESENVDSISVLNRFASLGVFQINNIHNSNNKLLDLVFVDELDSVEIHRSLPVVSPEDIHHPTLEVLLNCDVNYNEFENPQFEYNFKRTDVPKLSNLLSNLDWDIVLPLSANSSLSDFESCLTVFYRVLDGCFQQSVPIEKCLNKSGPCWYTKRLRSLRNAKTRVYKRYKRTNNPKIWSRYIVLRYQYNELCKQEYNLYIQNLIQNVSSCPKNFWDFINMKRKTSGFPSVMTLNNNSSNDSKTIANMFAEFFKTTFSNKSYDNSNYPYDISSSDIADPIINQELVLQALYGLKVSFKAGPDSIPSYILYTFRHFLVYPLTILFNYSFQTGCFPNLWKSSYVIPIHKSGSRSEISNYRGIAKLSAIPKLFEKVITLQLTFNVHKFISPHQHGFTSGRSTITNLLTFCALVIEGFAKGFQTDVIYTDLKKAFDKVVISLLLMKCAKFGFSEKLCNWLKSYLTNRSQRVCFGSSLSDEFSVLSGVPQGSHLGPLLFLIFINDLPQVIKYSKILMFADDVKLFLTHKSSPRLLQVDFDSLVSWCELNCMEFNVNKCKQMTYSRIPVALFNYELNNTPLEIVYSFEDLGVLLDTKLKFNLHINKIVNKAASVLGFMKRYAKEFNDPYITKLLYMSLVRPILEYASVVWCPRYDCYCIAIESIQKQFLLFCLRSLGWDYTNLPSYKSRLQLINLPSLQSRRTMLNISFIFKLINGDVECEYLHGRLNFNVPFRLSRNYFPLKLEYYTLNYLNFEPFRAACVDFNNNYSQLDFNLNTQSLKRSILSHLDY